MSSKFTVLLAVGNIALFFALYFQFTEFTKLNDAKLDILQKSIDTLSQVAQHGKPFQGEFVIKADTAHEIKTQGTQAGAEGTDLPFNIVKFPGGVTAKVAKGNIWDHWWLTVENEWETTTFKVLRSFLTKNTTYLGFGEWIGPTILYAAKFAEISYGLEPDPIAYKILDDNRRLNPELNIRISPECIADKNTQLTLHGIGNSMSVITELTNTTMNATITNYLKEMMNDSNEEQYFTVQCLTIWEYMRQQRCFTTEMLWKLDTEGAETSLIASWLEGLSELVAPKPTLFVSMHDTISKASAETRRRFVDVMKLYKYAGKIATFGNSTEEVPPSIPNGNQFTEADLCEWCDLLATDKEIHWV